MGNAIGKAMGNGIGKGTVTVVAAVAAGYLIGRTRKGRLVLAMASGVMMAGRGLAHMGLDQSKLRAVLVEVLADVQRSGGKALNAHAERLTDSLRSRTELLSGLSLDQEEAAEDEDDEDDVDEADEDADGAQASGRSSDRASDRNGGGREATRPARSANRAARSAGGAAKRAREPQTAARGRR